LEKVSRAIVTIVGSGVTQHPDAGNQKGLEREITPARRGIRGDKFKVCHRGKYKGGVHSHPRLGGRQGNEQCCLDRGEGFTLGGEESDNPGPKFRTLKTVFEDAGWFVTDSKGKRKNRTNPDMNKVLELMPLTKTGSVESGNTPSVAPPGCEWQALSVTVDSGACDHVLPPKEANLKEVKITEAVRQNVHYTTANGSKIPNLGEIKVSG